MAFMLKVADNTPSNRHIDADGLSEVELGSDIRQKEFLLRPNIAFFNHGSYGTVPKRVLKLQEQYNHEREEHPDFWFRLNAKVYLDRARQDIADFVGAQVENIQLVVNATSAINTVLRSFPFSSGDAILRCSFTYGAIRNLCEDFVTRIRPDVECVNLMLSFPPASEDEIISKYDEILSKHPSIKVAIIDHITSPSSVLLPVKRLTDLCHSCGVKVIVDGAHATGQLPLSLDTLGAEAYTCNVHKWLYTPRGCAVLHLSPDAQKWVNPPNTSWQIGQSLDKQFFDQGTRDHVPLICARHGLEFYNALGGMEKVVGYTRSMADYTVGMLEKELGLKPASLPKSMEAPNIRLLELPELKTFPNTSDQLWPIHRAMFEGTPVFGLVVPIEDKFYLRVSTQIYTSKDDVNTLVTVLRKFFKENC